MHVLGPFASPGGYEGVAFVNTKYSKNWEWPDIELVQGNLNMAQDGGIVNNNNLLRFKDEVKTTARSSPLHAGPAGRSLGA